VTQKSLSRLEEKHQKDPRVGYVRLQLTIANPSREAVTFAGDIQICDRIQTEHGREDAVLSDACRALMGMIDCQMRNYKE